jgi:16S rRNA (uracil1498-N3)-methyltransferase
MKLFFAEPKQINDTQIILDDFESRHIAQTLRKKTGDAIHLTDGCGNHYISEIIKDGKNLQLEIKHSERIRRSRTRVILGVGFIKPNRLELILEKCTELGVNEFILFKSHYTNYISFNKDRFLKIFRQAIKQSLQYYLPEITILKSLDEMVEQTSDIQHRFCAIDSESIPILDILNSSSILQEDSLLITIGPEGGFTPEEVEQMQKHKFLSVSLGQNRLRTETAAISTISIIQSFIQQKKEAGFGS